MSNCRIHDIHICTARLGRAGLGPPLKFGHDSGNRDNAFDAEHQPVFTWHEDRRRRLQSLLTKTLTQEAQKRRQAKAAQAAHRKTDDNDNSIGAPLAALISITLFAATYTYHYISSSTRAPKSTPAIPTQQVKQDLPRKHQGLRNSTQRSNHVGIDRVSKPNVAHGPYQTSDSQSKNRKR